MSEDYRRQSRPQVIEIDRKRQEAERLRRKANKAKGRLLKSLGNKGFEFRGHSVNKIDNDYVIVIRIKDKFFDRKDEVPEVHEGYKVDCQFVGEASTNW